MTTELLKQARDALAKAVSQFHNIGYGHSVTKSHAELIDKLDAYLSKPDWIRVEDALPVVPEGARYVEVWI